MDAMGPGEKMHEGKLTLVERIVLLVVLGETLLFLHMQGTAAQNAIHR